MTIDSISSFFSISQSASIKACLAAAVGIGLSIGTASAATQTVAAENFYGGVAATVAGDVNTQAPSVDTVMGKLELTEEYLRSLEAKAKIKMNELKAEKLFEQAKTDFADYITTLFQTGRHRHVLVAADFWRKIFDQGEYPVSMAQQVNASLEIAREVDGTIYVFDWRKNLHVGA